MDMCLSSGETRVFLDCICSMTSNGTLWHATCMYSVIPLALISTEDGVPYTVSIFAENSAGNGTVCNFTDFTNELCKFHSLSLMHVLCIKTPLCVWCRDGVNVLWWCSHLVWLVFEGSISTCICFHSENFFVTLNLSCSLQSYHIILSLHDKLYTVNLCCDYMLAQCYGTTCICKMNSYICTIINYCLSETSLVH